jgi:hypothetical protein
LDNCPGTFAQQHKVRHVVSEWEKYANIRFEHVDSQDATIRIAFDSLDGSWSHIGQDVKKVALDEPTMNLGCVDIAESLSPTDKGIILHEFGHVLGLGHEHQSPSREGKITLKEEGMVTHNRQILLVADLYFSCHGILHNAAAGSVVTTRCSGANFKCL